MEKYEQEAKVARQTERLGRLSEGAEEALNRGANAPGSDCAMTGIAIGNGIGWAVRQLWHGQQVRRRGWNGRGMHLALQVPDRHSKMTSPYVYMKTAHAQMVPWLCSQTDLLASDWELAEY